MDKKTKKKKKLSSEQDSMWKEILEEYFPQFLEFFFPDIYQDIDFTKKYEFLDKELQKIVKDSKVGKRLADKLVKVYLREGKELWLLIHCEVQGTQEKNFEERIYIYNYRIFDRYRKEVVSLAVFTDDNETFRPNRYERKRWGTKLLFEFSTVKLLDYKDKINELEKDRNPFALIVLTYLKMYFLKKNDPESLYSLKFSIVRAIIESGRYKREDVLNLLRFLDWLLVLPENLEIQFSKEILKIEEASKMPYVTSFEKAGYKKGLEEGLEKGKEEVAKNALNEGMPLEDISKFTGISIKKLRELKTEIK